VGWLLPNHACPLVTSAKTLGLAHLDPNQPCWPMLWLRPTTTAHQKIPLRAALDADLACARAHVESLHMLGEPILL